MQIDLSGNKFTFPHCCACCGGDPETSLTASASKSKGKKVVHTTTKSWAFLIAATVFNTYTQPN